jgi:5-hydroxyisourate hydrolase
VPLIKACLHHAHKRISPKEARMAGYLTTHVLDTALGCPGKGIRIDLYAIAGESRTFIRSLVTNDDGRTDTPILPKEEFRTGTYELVFHAGAYFDAAGVTLPEPKFLDQVPLRFGISEEAHYHVPLLVSPFGYSTYRGS